MGFLRRLTGLLPFLLLSAGLTVAWAHCNFISPKKRLCLGFLSNCLLLFFPVTALFLTDFVTSFSVPVVLSDHIPE